MAEIRHRHLILSLGRKGLGEAGLGLRLATELREAGDEVFFLTHDSNKKLFEGAFRHETVSSAASPLLQLYIQSCSSGFKPSSIILADYYITTLFFVLTGLEPEILTSLGIPIFAIDTWDSSKTPAEIDVLINDSRHLTLWPGKVRSICPVPFLAPQETSAAYGSLPNSINVPRKVRRHIRHTLGMNDNSRAVMFCTAEWQHPNYESQGDVARRFAGSVPELVAEYISRLGSDVHLIHVGPKAYKLTQLEDRYHWLPPLPPVEFDPLVASMDLLVSANISATTISKAMVFGVPTLALRNSISAASRAEAEAAMRKPATPTMGAWLEKATPIFPFWMWPLGYFQFLEPVLRKNPYISAVEVAELLDEEAVENSMTTLLYNKEKRDSHKHRQAAYVNAVRMLPTGPQLIHAALQ
jgi:hypothetical protein